MAQPAASNHGVEWELWEVTRCKGKVQDPLRLFVCMVFNGTRCQATSAFTLLRSPFTLLSALEKSWAEFLSIKLWPAMNISRNEDCTTGTSRIKCCLFLVPLYGYRTFIKLSLNYFTVFPRKANQKQDFQWRPNQIESSTFFYKAELNLKFHYAHP